MSDSYDAAHAHLSPDALEDTSEKTLTVQDIAEYAARREAAVDPLTAPLADVERAGQPTSEPRAADQGEPTDPGDPHDSHDEHTVIRDVPTAERPVPPGPSGPRGPAGPYQPPARSTPPGGWSPTGPVPPSYAPPAGRPPQPGQPAYPGQPLRAPAGAPPWPPAGPVPGQPGAPTGVAVQDRQGQEREAQEREAQEKEAEFRRFMSAGDFLDRRSGEQEEGPATWGWRGAVRRWTGGLIKPGMGPAERAYEHDRAVIQRDLDGPRTIAFINPKGGAAKTTGVLAAGLTFGTVRGGGVVAWDNNETRGTLGIRGVRSTHRNTTRELLSDLDRFSDVYQSRIGDLSAFVRAQGDAHFDVLASDERPDVTGTIRARDFTAVHELLERFYRIILVDTGNNMRAENWLAAAEAADLLVVTSTVREDTGYSGLWMLDALQDAGYSDLKHKTVTVLSDPSATVDEKLAHDLVQVYEQRTRGVFRVPYDERLVSGSVVPYGQLSRETTMSWLHACAGMAAAL